VNALKAQQVAASTYITGKCVRIIDAKQPKADKRTQLQSAMAELASYRASEEDLDAVLRTAVDKNMRV
jgi:peptidoglycan hydrolase-like amidase